MMIQYDTMRFLAQKMAEATLVCTWNLKKTNNGKTRHIAAKPNDSCHNCHYAQVNVVNQNTLMHVKVNSVHVY